MVPKTGSVECVTTSVVMVMNMVKDRLAHDIKEKAIPDISIKEYAARLDGMGMAGWRYRFPSNFPLTIARGWMHPVFQAPAALRRFAWELKKEYGVSFTVKQTAWNQLENITQALEAGNIVIIHGLWPITNPKEANYRFGGGPHTMVPVEIDSQAETLFLLNPADPDPRTVDPDNPATFPHITVFPMPIRDFLAFWGRKSFLNLYTRPFTMTEVIPDTN